MRKALTPEQVQQLLVEIDAWKVRGMLDEQLDKWRSAKIVSIEQVVEVDEVELYIVELSFPEGHKASFLLMRVTPGRLDACATLTYFAPDFTHPAQGDDPESDMEARLARQEQQFIEDKEYFDMWGCHSNP